MGFAQPQGYVPERIASGKVEADWSTMIRYISDILGFEVEEIRLDWETLVAKERLKTALEPIPEGTISGHRWKLSGIVKGRPSMQTILQFDPDPEDRGKMSVLAFTAMVVVNAIPCVVDSLAGIITDPIMGRGAVSRLSR